MYVAIRTGQGGKYLYVQTSVFVNGKSSVITVLKLGRLDKYIEENGENAVKELEARVKNGEFEHLLPEIYQKDIYKDRIKLAHSIDDSYSLLLKSNASINSLSYAHFYINTIVEGELDLSKKINNLMRYSYKNVQTPVVKALKCMINLRLLQPNSKYGDFNNRNCFLSAPFESLKLNDFYQSLTYIANLKDRIFNYIYSRQSNILDMSLVLYDATNIYYESPFTDSEYLAIKLRRYLISLGLHDSSESIIDFENPEIKDAVENFLSRFDDNKDEDNLNNQKQPDEVKINELKGKNEIKTLIRERGKNKQGRHDLPQVTITLLADRNGMPIDFETYKGNVSEFKTLRPTVEKFRECYGIKGNEIFIADRGLNARENIVAIKNAGLDALLSQRIDLLNVNCMSGVNPQEYVPDEDSALTSSELFAIEDKWDKIISVNDGVKHTTIYKEKSVDYTIEMEVNRDLITDESLIIPGSERVKRDKNKTQVCKIAIPAKILITWSKSRHDLEIATLERSVCKAKKFINTNQTLDNYSGFKHYINVKVLDKEGKIQAIRQADARKKGYTIKMSLRNDLVEKKEKTAGLYAYISTNKNITSDQIKEHYSQLVNIEESFKLLKQNLRTRPAYVRTDEHIKGHVAMSIITLIVLKRLYQKAKDMGFNLSYDEIIEGLRSCQVLPSPQQDGDIIGFLKSNPALAGRYNQEIIGKIKDQLATICGLEPLSTYNNKTQLAHKLGTRLGDLTSMLGESYIQNLRDHLPERRSQNAPGL